MNGPILFATAIITKTLGGNVKLAKEIVAAISRLSDNPDVLLATATMFQAVSIQAIPGEIENAYRRVMKFDGVEIGNLAPVKVGADPEPPKKAPNELAHDEMVALLEQSLEKIEAVIASGAFDKQLDDIMAVEAEKQENARRGVAKIIEARKKALA